MVSAAAFRDFQITTHLPDGDSGEPLLIAVCDQQVVCPDTGAVAIFVPPALLPEDHFPRHFLGVLDGRPCFAVDLPGDTPPPSGFSWRALRSLLGYVDESAFQLAGRACQVVQWDRQHRYCGRCGAGTVVVDSDRSRRCENCDEHFYPRLSPCVIVVIRRGEHCLLASNARWEGRFYSALAGFIEPGETAEQALHREVMEEVGIQVANLRYFASQPWPFPGQLMLGFHADYLAGEIQVDGEEIIAADWWHYTDLPPHPEKTTLSGQLIHHFIDVCRHGERR